MNRVTGLAFRKIDLHIHTPQSLCYGDRAATPEQIVEGALAANLAAIAITDHNTVAAIDDIRRVAGQNGLVVFPAIELTSRGGHVIALFELDTPTRQLEDFLDDAGITPDGRGDAANITDCTIEEAFQIIDGQGGIAIAAHIERWPSGFLETNEPRQAKMSIHNSDYLSALEITVPQNKALWNAGEMRGYPKKYACIQGSDAHAPDEIGRRPVYIRMEQLSLAALRSAFLDYETRIAFPDQFISGK